MNPQKDLLDVCKMIYADMERGHSINPYEHKATLKQAIDKAEIEKHDKIKKTPFQTLRGKNQERLLDAVIDALSDDYDYRCQVAELHLRTWTMQEIKSFVIPEWA